MGGRSQAKAQAAQARETARQYEDLKRRASKVKYDKEEVLANLKKASEQIPELAGMYEALQQDPTAMEKLETDPRFDEIMKGNLEAMQEMATESGFTDEDLAKRRQLERSAKAASQARQKSIVREMMQRGQAGSGTELLARLQASQDAATNEQAAMDRLAMDSAAARRGALAQATSTAQGMQGQQFGQRAARAQAMDARTARNLAAQQSAQDRNLQMRQQQENIRAQQAAGYYQGAAQTEQQRFANEMSKLGLQSNLTGAAGQARMAGVAPTRNTGALIGTAVGGIAGGIAAAKTGNPQLAMAGASTGAAIGGQFNEGGIKKQALNNISSRQAPMPSMQQESEPTAAEQIAAFNNLQRQKRFADGGISQSQGQSAKTTDAKPSEGKTDYEGMAALIGKLGEVMGKSNQPAPSVPMQTPQFDSSVQTIPMNYANGGIRAADGFNGVMAPQYNQQDPMGLGGFSAPQQPVSQGDLVTAPASQDSVSARSGQDFNRGLFSLTGDPKQEEFAPEGNSVMLPKKQEKTEYETIMDSVTNPRDQYVGDRELRTHEDAKRESAKITGGDKKETAKKEKKKEKKDEKKTDYDAMAKMIGQLGDTLGGSGKKAPAAMKLPTFNSAVSSMPIAMPKMGGINAADGAVKMTPEQMRDSLVQEVSAFACGGVKHGKKYEEGGISPELKQASQMLRTNKPAPASPMPGGQPPMPAPPMDPNMMPPQAPQMPPQGVPMDPAMLPPQGAPMAQQGQMMADGGMAYEDGGEGTIIPGENYEGDELPDRINSGEMVLNVEQQDRLNDQLMELKRLKSKERTDKMLADGTAEVNPMQQESLMAFVRGEIEVDDLPNERVVKEPTIGEPSGRMAELLGMLSKKRRG